MSVNKRKISDSIQGQKRGNFTQIPNEIWELSNIKPITKLIWCYIYSRHPRWDSSRNNVARNLSIEPNTAGVHIKILEDLNMLVVDRSKESWSFEIQPPEDWSTESKFHPDQILTQVENSPQPSQNLTQNRVNFSPTHNTNTNISLQSNSENSDLDNLRLLQSHAKMLNSTERSFVDSNIGLLENGGRLSENQRNVFLAKMLGKIKYVGISDKIANGEVRGEPAVGSKEFVGKTPADKKYMKELLLVRRLKDGTGIDTDWLKQDLVKYLWKQGAKEVLAEDYFKLANSPNLMELGELLLLVES